VSKVCEREAHDSVVGVRGARERRKVFKRAKRWYVGRWWMLRRELRLQLMWRVF
jgi:hypothetical protein